MTRTYDKFPNTTAAEVRAAFEYDDVHGRVLRRMANGGLNRCGTGELNKLKSVYVMWKRVYWPMELLIWMHGHGRWPTQRITRLVGYKTHLSNLAEKEPKAIPATRPKIQRTQNLAPVDTAHPLQVDFAKVFLCNVPDA